MAIDRTLKHIWQRVTGAAVAASAAPAETTVPRANALEQTTASERKTAMLPAILSPWGGMQGSQVATRSALPKPTPANLRRFAETPVVRRAINVVKDKIASMDWQVRVRRGYNPAHLADCELRLAALRRALEEPNPSDSFRVLFEQVIEDLLVGGFGAIEMETTGDPALPFRLYAVDGATIQIDSRWNGAVDRPHYAQATGRPGIDALVPLRDDELMYLRLNPRTHTPFGLGRLEVAFETVNQFLSANRYAGRLAANSVVQYALWLNEASPEQHDRLIRWWQDEIEGTGRVPVLSTPEKPEVLRFAGGTDADLRLAWQEMLIRLIANAFELPPMLLGVSHDVNKATAGEFADEAFQSAVVPVAKLIAEHITRDLFAKRLGWREFEFCFNDLETRDETREVEMQRTLLECGVLTVDEVRQMRGLPPLTPPEVAPAEPAPETLRPAPSGDESSEAALRRKPLTRQTEPSDALPELEEAAELSRMGESQPLKEPGQLEEQPGLKQPNAEPPKEQAVIPDPSLEGAVIHPQIEE